MAAVLSQKQKDLNAEIAETRDEINGLKEKLRRVQTQLDGLAAERERYRLLEDVCRGLDKLEELGAGDLFWGERTNARKSQEHFARARELAAAFAEKVSAIEQRRRALEENIERELSRFDLLSDELFEQQEREESIKYEFVVHRDLVLPPYAPAVMPWTEEDEDRRRLRKSMLAALLAALLFGIAMTLWKLPLRDKADVTEIPERLVELVQRAKPTPPEPKPVEQKKPEEKKEDKPEPVPEAQKARAKAEQTGLLAFKNTFADLMEDNATAKLGADARVSDRGKQAIGRAERALVVAQAREGSGGINTAAISRNVGGTGSKVGGVQFTRVESSVGGLQESDRPLSDGPGPSRTDEEIQIVFDRYKAALYRIYNRELRNDPTLKGKMVLRLTIEPSGAVTACTIESSDLASEALKTEVVARVKRFNFGPKEGVPRITILYPIDFLPAG